MLAAALVEQAHGPVFAKDLHGRFVVANAAAHRALGVAPGHLVGRRLEDVTPTVVHEDALRNDAAVLSHGPQVFTESVPGVHGARDFVVAKFPITDDDGEVRSIGAVALDVSTSEWLRAELAITQEQYRVLAESATTGVLVTAGPDHVVRWCNLAAARMHGVARVDKLVGRSLLETVDPLEREEMRAQYASVLTGEPLETRAYRVLNPGTDRERQGVVDLRARRMQWDGEPAVVTELLDVTDQAEDAERVARSERRLSSLFAQAPVGYFEAGTDGRLHAVNHRLALLLGREVEDWAGRMVEDLLVPGDRAALRARLRRATAGEQDEGGTAWSLRTATGQHVPVQVHLSPVRDDDGAVDRLAGVVLDDRKAERYRTEAVERGRRLEQLVRAMPDAVLICSQDGTITQVNDQAEALFGYPPGEMVGLAVETLVPVERAERHVRHRDRFVATSHAAPMSTGLDIEALTRDGRRIPVEVLLSAVTLGTGPAVVASVRDMTASRRLSQELAHSRDLLAGVLDAATEQAVVAIDLDGVVEVFNSGAELLLQCPAAEAVGRRLDEFVEPGDLAALFADAPDERWAGVARAVTTSTRTTPRRYVTRAGTVRDVLQSITVRHGAGGVVGLVVVATDVTDRLAREAALADSEQRFRLAFDHATTGMALADLSSGVPGRFLQVNQALCDLVRYSEGELLGADLTAITHPDDLDATTAVLDDLRTGRLGSARREVRYRRADGATIWVDESLAVVLDAHGTPAYVVAQHQDVTGRKVAEEALTRAAMHDGLTGLANRALLVDHVTQEVARMRRDGGGLGLIYLDLDNFKDVNDSLGHEAGDALLVEIAGRLRRCVRDVDTAARLGGDEFVVLCTGLTSIDELVALAQRIERALALDIIVGATSLSVTVSAGLVFRDDTDVDAEDLLRDADAAMYQAKRNGGHRYEVADPALQARALRQLSLEAELRQALREAEGGTAVPGTGLSLVYQPSYDTRTGSIVACEALLRWQHPTRGLLSPDAFLDVAEERALMWPLGLWIMRTAVRQAATWYARLGAAAPQMWVNVSAGQLGKNLLAERTLQLLVDHGLPTDRLCVEITERQVVRGAHSTTGDLSVLRAAGVDVAIDDFGTGHAGMDYLRRLPVTVMKIDRSFVNDVTLDEAHAALAASMVAMGRSMDLKIVAEGVETAAQHDVVVALGCDLEQGFWLARPMPADDVERLLTGVA
ncbi:PAS domain S-box protein [Cellulomonas sp. SLBN-39]|uniref:PAS domain S-box protein n=1 Tax=Cellulomonas sp. SLBN-39 TaxID=2768446 RepID=UPI00135C58C2|nr:PAS domain S-box protein [Cellulomonas sp. SLBN-39]